ncbi:hypothetical protein SCG7109_AN_00240 [Chlamydiales bacterium SCGC AG-110-M15]|nr:hypothetical protein SCG7109_AN_00240 [Chlamydiales bacterium SCGC AG-110-M15]
MFKLLKFIIFILMVAALIHAYREEVSSFLTSLPLPPSVQEYIQYL